MRFFSFLEISEICTQRVKHNCNHILSFQNIQNFRSRDHSLKSEEFQRVAPVGIGVPASIFIHMGTYWIEWSKVVSASEETVPATTSHTDVAVFGLLGVRVFTVINLTIRWWVHIGLNGVKLSLRAKKPYQPPPVTLALLYLVCSVYGCLLSSIWPSADGYILVWL